MKLHLASSNRAFTRTQGLLLVCLMVVAFEIGIRIAEKQQAEKKAATIIQTTVVETNYWQAREERKIETVLPQLVTNAPTVTSVVRPVKPQPKPITYVPPTYGGPKEWAQQKVLKADGPVTKHKTTLTEPLPQAPSAPSASPENPGVRIALP